MLIYTLIIFSGALLPLGKIQDRYDIDHVTQVNEYIAYDERQICLRYLVQFKD